MGEVIQFPIKPVGWAVLEAEIRAILVDALSPEALAALLETMSTFWTFLNQPRPFNLGEIVVPGKIDPRDGEAFRAALERQTIDAVGELTYQINRAVFLERLHREIDWLTGEA